MAAWILDSGFWNDAGIWDDTSVWMDGPYDTPPVEIRGGGSGRSSVHKRRRAKQQRTWRYIQIVEIEKVEEAREAISKAFHKSKKGKVPERAREVAIEAIEEAKPVLPSINWDAIWREYESAQEERSRRERAAAYARAEEHVRAIIELAQQEALRRLREEEDDEDMAMALLLMA